MQDQPKTKWRWRLLRWGLIGLACLITLAGIAVTEENWRGKRDWENYQREQEAKGEKFDWQAFCPPAVPDDQNFFTAPIFSNLLNGKIVMNPYHSDGSPDLRSKAEASGYLGGEGKASKTDLKAWQASYRHPADASLAKEFPSSPQPQTPARDVLFALGKFDSAVEELRQASRRPYASVPLHYEDGFNSASSLLPILAELKRCTQVLQLRADAELADGQSDKALDDVKLLLYLSNTLRNSPFLISYLVRIAVVDYELQPVWEGLAAHQWSEEQLVALDSELSNLDFLADYESVMRGENAFAIASIENERHTREMISSSGGTNGWVTNKLTFMPSAFFYQNELAFAQLNQRWLLPLVNAQAHIVSPKALQRAENSAAAGLKHYSPYRVQALMLFPAIGRSVEKFAAIQSSIDLARIACALERYRLARNQYPENLDALEPQFIAKLPHDIINGQPLHYRRTEDGRFLLYSVGWDEKDDGGKVYLTKTGAVDKKRGDWVWQYPAQ